MVSFSRGHSKFTLGTRSLLDLYCICVQIHDKGTDLNTFVHNQTCTLIKKIRKSEEEKNPIVLIQWFQPHICLFTLSWWCIKSKFNCRPKLRHWPFPGKRIACSLTAAFKHFLFFVTNNSALLFTLSFSSPLYALCSSQVPCTHVSIHDRDFQESHIVMLICFMAIDTFNVPAIHLNV